jgi:tryptophan halogenase
MEYEQINFVVVGGGTAGWITALKIRKHFPENKITVIESSEIGILGAGEGTTPSFVQFLHDIDININDFIKNTKATIKDGIKFTNWHGDNTHYLHPFFESLDCYETQYISKIHSISQNENLNKQCLFNYTLEQNKTKFFINNDRYESAGCYSFHFDARMTATYLKGIGASRNIQIIDSKVKNFLQDDNGFIYSIHLDNDQLIDCNFVFDCTGFARRIIGNLYKENWLDYQKSLPVDRALPFFIENKTNVIPPYTEAIAMKYGWIWKIPVQGRFGCGYVFDSSYTTDQEAEREIEALFGNVEIPRSFSFKAGYYENTWVKNCVAIGLSSGFIEPLEATSIWVSLVSLDCLLKDFLHGILDKNDKSYKNNYNTKIREMNDQIKGFIQLHYLTNRQDSLFWQDYRTKNTIVDDIKKYQEAKNVYEFLQLTFRNYNMFNPWYVFAGVNFYPNEIFKLHLEQIKKIPHNFNFEKKAINFKKELIYFSNFKAVDHFEFIELVNNL